jgi:hypothetical protein
MTLSYGPTVFDLQPRADKGMTLPSVKHYSYVSTVNRAKFGTAEKLE